MMYIIEEDFFYDEANNAIWHRLSENEKTQLPLTASRILCLLLENRGKVMSREHIFDEIWSNYGANASNNTLNQYVSLLRKKFEQLGFQGELIKTITRAGFLMPEDLKVQQLGVVGKPVAIENKKPGKKIIITSVVCLLAITIIGYAFINRGGWDKSNVFKIGSVGRCNVYMLYQNSPETAEVKLRLAKEMIDKYAPCIGNDVYIYHPSDEVILNGQGAAFITRCTYQKDGSQKFAGCYDVYEFPKA
ncbi:MULTISPECIES: helix-turn-helix domain-containing protein [Pantoea]|uniref:winged helix-turn-helix domain-containing protein n=1 Tax=Pantoea TaxID=53335 RepID=UPI001F3E63D6|nr:MULTISPECIES: helix-turn-helix domain-containing protein [Pantoea]UIL54646.1 helix-turn-helix domain-containing protein [Pantoea agglomerans]